jgi:hypothetical protein
MNDIKNPNQKNYNSVQGKINQIIKNTDSFYSIVLLVGHENPRFVCIRATSSQYERIENNFKVDDFVKCLFYINSKYKNGVWYTTANLIKIEKPEF